jgi:D-alanine-D-alanine ligase-like ATP-grasp enzyme
MSGNWRAMKPLAVLRTDRPAWRAASLSPDRGRVNSLDRPPRGVECDPASQAFDEYDAKDAESGMHHSPRANLKPNIYYKAQDFTLGVDRAPGCRGVGRADRHLSGTAAEEGEPVSLEVNARPGQTVTSPAPDRTAQAGFSFDEPVARVAEDAACDC